MVSLGEDHSVWFPHTGEALGVKSEPTGLCYKRLQGLRLFLQMLPSSAPHTPTCALGPSPAWVLQTPERLSPSS